MRVRHSPTSPKLQWFGDRIGKSFDISCPIFRPEKECLNKRQSFISWLKPLRYVPLSPYIFRTILSEERLDLRRRLKYTAVAETYQQCKLD